MKFPLFTISTIVMVYLCSGAIFLDRVTLPDGSLLVSDDRAGAVYRIDYRVKRGG